MVGGRGYKVPFEQVKSEFQDRGYRLLSKEYVNNHTKLDFICPSGHKGQTTWMRFKRGHRCINCFREGRRIPMEQVRQQFKERGYQLVSTEYVNCDALLDFVCPEGHNNTISWSNFNQGHGCSECNNNRKLTIDKIRLAFDEEGFKLISRTYKNAHGKLKFECSNGHKHQMTWNDFRNGTRCAQCWEYRSEKQLGQILEEIFPGQIEAQSNLGFLGRQKVDYWVRGTRLAFEYDGEQHFKPVRFRGISQKKAEEIHEKIIKRDCHKNQLCKRNGYILVRISYKDRLDIETVKAKLSYVREVI